MAYKKELLGKLGQLSFNFASYPCANPATISNDVPPATGGVIVVSFERHKTLQVRELLIQDLIKARVPVER